MSNTCKHRHSGIRTTACHPVTVPHPTCTVSGHCMHFRHYKYSILTIITCTIYTHSNYTKLWYYFSVVRYGWKFLRGIYFGRLAVLRTICQWFNHQAVYIRTYCHYSNAIICGIHQDKFLLKFPAISYAHTHSYSYCTPMVCKQYDQPHNTKYHNECHTRVLRTHRYMVYFWYLPALVVQ